MRASARAALLVSGAAVLALGVAPALAAPQVGPTSSDNWVAERRGDEGKIKGCPGAGADGVGHMSPTTMGSAHRAHHGVGDGDGADGMPGMAGMHRSHHRDGAPGGMMDGRHGDMMGSDERDDMMNGHDADDMMGGRDADDMMGSARMGG